MSTNKINRPLNMQPNLLQNFQPAGRPDGRKDAAAPDGAAASGAEAARPTEKLEISENARKLTEMRELLAAGRAALAREPEIREENVAQARRRIAEGFYDQPAARSEAAANIAATLETIGKFVG